MAALLEDNRRETGEVLVQLLDMYQVRVMILIKMRPNVITDNDDDSDDVSMDNDNYGIGNDDNYDAGKIAPYYSSGQVTRAVFFFHGGLGDHSGRTSVHLQGVPRPTSTARASLWCR